MSRLESIRKMVAAQPGEAFPRYGLAMELRSQGQLDDSHAEFEELERRCPDYVAQYLMHHQVLVQLEKVAEARAVAERGIAVARKKNDGHALGELQAALDTLGGGDA